MIVQKYQIQFVLKPFNGLPTLSYWDINLLDQVEVSDTIYGTYANQL